jgi:very-short-patch-repair endonuclease/predicted transcriptional regulator of viral defense system
VAAIYRQIAGKTSTTPVDAALARLAERQYGVVARRQLFALGISARTTERWIARGRLHGIHHGVYALGHRSLTSNGRWLAAVLAAGPNAVLSHRSAAALWGLRPAAGSRIDVTVHARGRGSRQGIAVHTTRELLARDRALRARIPVTSVARTLLDLAGAIPEQQLTRTFEQADRLDLLDLRAIHDVCLRGRGRAGLGVLLRLLADQTGSAPATRSELERLFVDFCQEHRLPRPQLNALVAGFEVDALWPGKRLIVELDSFAFHKTRGAFERDRERDAALLIAGYRVLRFTHRRLQRDQAAVAATLRAALASAPAS